MKGFARGSASVLGVVDNNFNGPEVRRKRRKVHMDVRLR